MRKATFAAGWAFAILAMSQAHSGQEVIFPVTFGPERAPGELQVIGASADASTLRLRGGEQRARVLELPEGRFLDLERPTGTTTRVGAPALPVTSTLLEVPFGAHDFNVEILSQAWTEHDLAEFGADFLLPHQPPVPKIPGAWANASLHFDRSTYTGRAFTPASPVTVAEAGIMREHRLVRVAVHSVQYSPATGKVRVLQRLAVRITHAGGNAAATRRLQKRYASPFFDQLLDHRVANYRTANQVIPRSRAGQPSRWLSAPVGYVIVVPDSLVTDIQPFADWKTHVGYDVTVAPTSVTGTTTSAIKTYLQTAYNSWPVPPQFVLLVGDTGQVPAWQGSETSSVNDLQYVTMNAGDYFADMFIGRFSVTNATQLGNVLDKVLHYEQLSSTVEPWIENAVFMASTDNYTISEGTHNYVISNYLDPAGYTTDKLYTVTYNATTSDVSNSLNAGRSLAIYSGHGGEFSWADGPPFSQANINALTNYQEYPIVCSHACMTGDYEQAECFGETWQRAPGKGGVFFWGASTYSYWDEDDILEKGMFESCFANGVPFVTGFTNDGLLAVYNYYGGGGRTEYYYQEYNVLADPSMLLRTAQPVIPVVTHDTALPLGAGVLSVNVLTGGTPMAGAMVHAAKGTEVFATVFTDAAGNATIPVSTTTPGPLDLVVTGPNLVIYDTDVTIFVPSGPYVVLDDHTVNDAVGGNGDGDLDIGETIELPVCGGNVGLVTAYGVTATLTTSDPLITITDGVETLGDIAASTVVWTPDDFDFTVSSACEDGRVVPFTVTFTDNGTNVWSYDLYLPVNAPKAVCAGSVVTEVIGNGNGRPDPGETLEFGLTLRNDGHHVAEDLSVVLHTFNPRCTITSGTSAVDDLLPGATGTNTTPLSAELAKIYPGADNVIVNVDVYRGANLCASEQVTFTIGKAAVLIIDLDPNHSSAPAIEASLTANGIPYDYTMTGGPMMNYQSVFFCLGIYSDNTQLSTTQANAIVNYLNAGGCVYMEGSDCWAYDSSASIYNDEFGISGDDDGDSDTATIVGQAGTIADGLNFTYTGENGWMDHLSALAGADLIFRNQSPSYGNGVAHDNGTWRTIGVSFEFGGLTDGPGGTRNQWMKEIVSFFGLQGWSNTAETKF